MNPKITHRKLGKENAWGQAWKEDNHIELDSRLVGKPYLETAIHEFLHIQEPKFSENKVTKLAKALSEFLWELEFRKVDNRERQKKT